MTDGIPPFTIIPSSCPPALPTLTYDQDSDKAYISVSDINSKPDSLQESNLFALHLNIVSLVKNISHKNEYPTRHFTQGAFIERRQTLGVICFLIRPIVLKISQNSNLVYYSPRK